MTKVLISTTKIYNKNEYVISYITVRSWLWIGSIENSINTNLILNAWPDSINFCSIFHVSDGTQQIALAKLMDEFIYVWTRFQFVWNKRIFSSMLEMTIPRQVQNRVSIIELKIDFFFISTLIQTYVKFDTISSSSRFISTFFHDLSLDSSNPSQTCGLSIQTVGITNEKKAHTHIKLLFIICWTELCYYLITSAWFVVSLMLFDINTSNIYGVWATKNDVKMNVMMWCFWIYMCTNKAPHLLNFINLVCNWRNVVLYLTLVILNISLATRYHPLYFLTVFESTYSPYTTNFNDSATFSFQKKKSEHYLLVCLCFFSTPQPSGMNLHLQLLKWNGIMSRQWNNEPHTYR